MRVKALGHYHVVEKLGEGGMGVVYRATDLLLRRDVALKILPQDFSQDSRRMERFRWEARVLASLNHPGIGAIYDLLDCEVGPALVMELVEGPTLADRLETGPIPPEEIPGLALQMVGALEAAHARGIIHRDLKPANAKMAQDGRLKILDFGLAVALPEESDSSEQATVREATLSGTIPYMAPEQLRGEDLDVRADVYALGALLYEMAVGRGPFGDAQGATLIGAIQYKAPLPPRSFNPRIPRGLEEIIMRCLEKAPCDRYATMSDVADALRNLDSQTTTDRSLAVLYFENLGRSEEDEYLCNGITEDIIVELSRIQGLSVLPRSSVQAYRNQMTTATQAGHELGVSHVLDGSLRRAGNRLRITATLIETTTARTVWAERFDRQLEDVFAIQEELAQSISYALRVMLTPAQKRAMAKVPTTRVEAYQYYLRGRQHFEQFRRKSIEFARDMFVHAIETDPEYSRAYSGLADCYSYLYMFWVATDENVAGAEDASRKAVELDPDSAEAHVARGVALSLRKDLQDAESEFLAATRLDPERFEAYYFGARGHYARGNLKEAVAWFEKAHQVRPEDYQAPCLLGSALAGLGLEEESAAAYRMSLDLAQKHLDLHPGDARALYFSAISLAQLREDADRSLELANRALAMDPDEPQVLYNVACVYALLDQADRAMDCLEEVMTHGDWWRGWTEHDPDLASLRDHPRFRALFRGQAHGSSSG